MEKEISKNIDKSILSDEIDLISEEDYLQLIAENDLEGVDFPEDCN